MSVVDVKPTNEVLFVAEDGTPVTGNMILGWCDAYDRGEYPAPVVERKKVGRPSLSGKPKKSPRMSFRLGEEGQANIELAAKIKGVSTSAFIRDSAEEAARRVIDQAS